MIRVNDKEPRDYTIDAQQDEGWVEILIYPHSLRVVKALIAWRDTEDRSYFKKTGEHLYAPYRARKL